MNGYDFQITFFFVSGGATELTRTIELWGHRSKTFFPFQTRVSAIEFVCFEFFRYHNLEITLSKNDIVNVESMSINNSIR